MESSNLASSLWQKICGNLRTTLPPHVYRSLVETTGADESETGLSLVFRDDFTKESFEQKCLPAVRAAMERLQTEVPVALRVSMEDAPASPQFEFSVADFNPFDSKYTFETYVVGTSNQFAHAACQAVSRQPGKCYNPLFIFGGSGLGKTHLLKAIGYTLFQSQRGLRIHLIDAETFTNEVIQAIRTDRMREFREKYRTRCDVLLLDDIHFFVGKDRTQEEFFYTFNYLHEACKQIVITSDRYPKDIQGLETRLQTRFEWGLVADVQPPEIETRIAILQNKAEQENIKLPDAVAQYIASHITTNIRTLEGSLRRLQAHSALSSIPISVALAQEILRDVTPKTKHEVTADAILKLVALHFNVRTTDLKADKRIRKLSVPRQICMYLLRKHLMISFPEIGKFMGGKDHSTVMHGVTKVAEALKADLETLHHISTIESLMRY